ncbi:VOC family protein [Streptomyces triticirhizae]|uniref:VOC family protein n=1 Tax=Streptomyces triticirhizae TaxID=2483353 RepID=A0A3M2M995_9ACTN|nr:VOC family protein [Streptomyces triticirhizae]RMI46052.1 VOC family protein [Streptomyces triticirhizae]
MTITLNHALIPARDHLAAADFLASVLDLPRLPPDGQGGHFAPVRVNDTLTLEFVADERPAAQHLAFDVDPETFDGILARLTAAGVPFGDDPSDPANGSTAHPLCARGLYFVDPDGHLWEVMSPA